MYEVLCERCWHTEAIDGESTTPTHPCPECNAEGAWLGPFAEAAAECSSRRDTWPVLTSPFYVHGGQPDRRMRPR